MDKQDTVATSSEAMLPLSDNSPERCGTCNHTKKDDNLRSHQRICGEGYGIRRVDDTPVNKWCWAEKAVAKVIARGFCGMGIGGDES